MTPLSKTFLAFMAIAIVVAGTLVLRPASQEPGQSARLTPAQLAEMQPSPPPQPQLSVKPADSTDLPPPPPDDGSDPEDGNGS